VKTILIAIMALFLIGCCKKSNKSTPIITSKPVVEYKLAESYSFSAPNGEASIFGMLLGYNEIHTRIGVIDSTTCLFKTVLHKSVHPNPYLLHVYGSNQFASNVEVCSELEGIYSFELTSDSSANFRVIETY